MYQMEKFVLSLLAIQSDLDCQMVRERQGNQPAYHHKLVANKLEGTSPQWRSRREASASLLNSR
jgi:hypothetical protein